MNDDDALIVTLVFWDDKERVWFAILGWLFLSFCELEDVNWHSLLVEFGESDPNLRICCWCVTINITQQPSHIGFDHMSQSSPVPLLIIKSMLVLCSCYACNWICNFWSGLLLEFGESEDPESEDRPFMCDHQHHTATITCLIWSQVTSIPCSHFRLRDQACSCYSNS